MLFERPLYLLFNLWLQPTLRAEPPFDFFSGEEKLGTGHYLSNGGGAGGAGGEVTWYLGEQKRESVVTENPKDGITENFGRIQRGTTQICLENEGIRWGGGGSRKSSNVIRGNHFKGRIG